MFSPQDLQSKKFEKAVFGGYDMSQVDEFLDSLFDDYTNLYKENVTLKSKMKVLADKVEEYRSVDDELRKMLYTAQTKAKEIVAAAEEEARAILLNAKNDAQASISDMKAEYDKEQGRLYAIKKETADYSEKVKELLTKNIEIIDKYIEKAPEQEIIPPKGDEYKKPSPDTFEFSLPKDFIVDKEEIDDTKEIGDLNTVEATELHKPVSIGAPVPPIQPEQRETSAQEDENMTTKYFEVQLGQKESNAHKKTVDDAEESDTGKIYGNSPFTPKPRFRFDDLRFGSNYDEDEPEEHEE